MTAAQAIAYIRAAAASRKASEVRRNLPPGSSRARITSANATWASHAEERARLAADLPVDFVRSIDLNLSE